MPLIAGPRSMNSYCSPSWVQLKLPLPPSLPLETPSRPCSTQ